MFKMHPEQIDELCKIASFADKEARSDLARGYIRDEDDYTSNFTGALRRIINSHSRFGLKATSFMLGTAEERRTGCDASIIISTGVSYKVSTFEAKLPWSKSQYRDWDYEQTSSGLSHFSDQLARQSKLSPNFAVFEMFYCGFEFKKQPNYLPDYYSACVWHKDASTFDASRQKLSNLSRPWKESELIALVQQSRHEIGKILREVCECRIGTHLTMSGGIGALVQEHGIPRPALLIEALDAMEE